MASKNLYLDLGFGSGFTKKPGSGSGFSDVWIRKERANSLRSYIEPGTVSADGAAAVYCARLRAQADPHVERVRALHPPDRGQELLHAQGHGPGHDED